uniref:Uncharacterized protein n=1 Tax=Acanthochromis polyacanthus TaxID=80966 RepID=A0A3Q1GET9_9TELE
MYTNRKRDRGVKEKLKPEKFLFLCPCWTSIILISSHTNIKLNEMVHITSLSYHFLD